jgi:hypothetical protein
MGLPGHRGYWPLNSGNRPTAGGRALPEIVQKLWRTRLRALYRQWLDDPTNTLWMAGSTTRADALDRDHGRRNGPAPVRRGRSRHAVSPSVQARLAMSMRKTHACTVSRFGFSCVADFAEHERQNECQ